MQSKYFITSGHLWKKKYKIKKKETKWIRNYYHYDESKRSTYGYFSDVLKNVVRRSFFTCFEKFEKHAPQKWISTAPWG